MKRGNLARNTILCVLIFSLMFCLAACAKDEAAIDPGAGTDNNSAATDPSANTQADSTLEAPADSPSVSEPSGSTFLPSGAEIGEDGKYILRIYPSFIVVRTSEGDLIAKHYSEQLPEETLMETIDPNEATMIFYDSEGNIETFEPTIGNTGFTHTDLISMSDAELATYPTATKIAGYWVLQSTTDGPGDFETIRIDDDGYVYAQLDGKMYDGLWWETYEAISRIRFSLRPDTPGGNHLYIFEFEIHPDTLILRYIDNTNKTCGEEYIYSRQPLDYTQFDALPGHEQLISSEIEPYLHGIWYCEDPYLDTQKLPYKLIFSPSFESDGIVSFIMANINDQWTYAWVGEGEITYNDRTYYFEVIDQNTMRIWWKYFQGSFNEEDLGLAEAVYTKISYYANTSHNY